MTHACTDPGAPGPRFYLGTHQPHWLWDPAAGFCMFVSHRTLAAYKTLRPSTAPWALDSGGFTELSRYGRWTTSPREYAEAVARYQQVIGRVEWAAPQDWMCEPQIIHGGGPLCCPGTHLPVTEHQRRTVANFMHLRDLWPSVSNGNCPFVPVLQGWHPANTAPQCTPRPESGCGTTLWSASDRCAAGRPPPRSAAWPRRWPPRAWRCTGSGVKTLGLLAYGHHLSSADSMAWSFEARRSAPLPGHRHKNCANCLPYATAWRGRLLAGLATAHARGHQQPLFPPSSAGTR